MIVPLMHYSENNNSQDVDIGTLNLLKEQHQFLTSVLDEVIDPILVIGTDFKVKFANKAACNFANDKGCFQVTEPRCHKLIFNSNLPCSSFGKACPLIEVLESDDTAVIESEHTMPNGTTSLFEIKASPLFNHDGESLGIVESFRDITDRKKYATIPAQTNGVGPRQLLVFSYILVEKEVFSYLRGRFFPTKSGF